MCGVFMTFDNFLFFWPWPWRTPGNKSVNVGFDIVQLCHIIMVLTSSTVYTYIIVNTFHDFLHDGITSYAQ